MQDEMIRGLVGGRVQLTHWARAGEGEWMDGFTMYDAGVSYVNGVKLVSATEVGIVIESTGSAGDGERFFLPWSGVIMLSGAREQSPPEDVL